MDRAWETSLALLSLPVPAPLLCSKAWVSKSLSGSQAACLRPGVCGLCPWSSEPALMCSDELMPRDPRLENDSGPDAIKPWASQVLMKAGILQITPKIYII